MPKRLGSSHEQLQAEHQTKLLRRAPKLAANTLRKRAHTSLNMPRPALLLLAAWQAVTAFRVPAPVAANVSHQRTALLGVATGYPRSRLSDHARKRPPPGAQ